jgi:glucose/arabinose dehydrogenase/cytochrome c551/c552/type 1 glutamine amidotransferase
MIKIRMVVIGLFSLITILTQAQKKVLVFSKTAGYRHSSIEVGRLAIMKLGKENGFDVDTTENASMFSDKELKKYSAVIFFNATGDVLDHYQQAAFERYIQAGGGYMGIHAATDCEYTWPWYGKLSGAYFKSHPNQQKATLIVHDRTHISTAHLPEKWERFDEWYNFTKAPGNEVKVLISIDEKSYQGGENGASHPMAWYHEYDGGRAFYTEFGHTDESYVEPFYLKHILGGILYAMGNDVTLDYNKVKTALVPDEDRFSRQVLAGGGLFDEPTEMAILPNLDILIVQRKGEVLLYKNTTKKITQIAKLDLYHQSGVKDVNAEEGLMGITADPDFIHNNYIYLFYATNDTAANRLSRFIFKDGKLDLSSEKKILDVAVTRKICCHTGGSLTFGPDGSLYLSTGDNTTPFDQPDSKYQSQGYGPIDNREGFEQFDGRRGSSNTNDLRGKVLRIKVNQDGTYSIPEGNLFKPGTPNTRPEIYAMGARNPYRISVDKKTGFLYWGDVGPDAGSESPDVKGSRGYDELNQARKPGYFGYPLFIGNNYPYRQFNYETGEVGDFFDPKKPMNLSKNNTGLTELPPVSPAFIWYPYAASPDFPEVGKGGRNAMAGPIYHSEMYPKETRYPDYYNGKLLFYEWIRGWMKMVTMDQVGNYEKMEPIWNDLKFKSPIDIEVGPDGRFYVLEYGSGWFSKNTDAGLSRVDYNGGNRAPRTNLKVDKISASVPFKIKADADGTKDADGDPITYTWYFGKLALKPTASNKASFTFNVPGEYQVYFLAKDSKGATTKSEIIKVYAGNELPVVDVSIQADNDFYIPGVPVNYKVSVKDKEDGSTATSGIDPKSIFVKVDYVNGPDKAQTVGHQGVTAIMEGRNLAAILDCKACHKEAEKSIGPAYKMVATKYEKDPKARAYLTNKIIKGGGGVWGEAAMSAHPDLKKEDANLIVDWILNLNKKEAASLPSKGQLTATKMDAGRNNMMQVTATYTDKGAKGIKPLTSYAVALLKGSVVGVEKNKEATGIQIREDDGDYYADLTELSGWLKFDGLNLKGVTSVELQYDIDESPDKGYKISWFSGGLNGTKIGEISLDHTLSSNSSTVTVPLSGLPNVPSSLYMKIEKADASEKQKFSLVAMKFIGGQ